MSNEVMALPEVFVKAGHWMATPAMPVGEVAMQRSPVKPLTPRALNPLMFVVAGASFAVNPAVVFMAKPVWVIGIEALHVFLSPLPADSTDQPDGGVVPVFPIELKSSEKVIACAVTTIKPSITANSAGSA